MPFDPGREGRLLVAAAALLTRVPMPAVVLEPDWLPRSARYFPLVGLVVGAIAAAVLVGAGAIWPAPIPAMAAVAAALLLTGALHEDGLADTADGLGGRTREARLAIMKDARLGTFGAAALLACLGLRVAAIAAMPPWVAATSLLGAHAGARLAAVLLMAAQPYAGDPGAAKIVQPPRRIGVGCLAVAICFGLGPVLALSGRGIPALVFAAAASGLVAWRVCRALGGQTGDVLGAVAATFETFFLLGAAADLGLDPS